MFQNLPHLIDINNPLAINPEGKVTHHYITQILGIKKDLFLVPKEWKQGREYFLR